MNKLYKVIIWNTSNALETTYKEPEDPREDTPLLNHILLYLEVAKVGEVGEAKS